MSSAAHQSDRTGLLLAVAAYASWGLLPLYFRLLHDVPPVQLLAHRVVWSLLLLVLVAAAMRRIGSISRAARGRTLALLTASAALIGANWFIYIWAVANGHVIEASLGYFVTPFANVALGVFVLRERIGRAQVAAIGLAVLGVGFMATRGGHLWISIALAISFSTYGLIRKVASIDALGGLTVETLLLAPVCLYVIADAAMAGKGAFGQATQTDILLITVGAATALPLLMFAAAARRLRYSTMGLLQYISPTLQFALAVLVFGEAVRRVQLTAFALIWTGCALFAWESVRSASRPRAGAAAG